MSNEVKIRIAATDAVGPGIDSAKQKFRGLEKDIAGSSNSLGMLIKAAGGLAAIEAGFKLTTTAVQAFKGDLSGVRSTLESLPLGVGTVIRSINELADEVDGVTASFKLMEEARKSAIAEGQRLGKMFDAREKALEDIEAIKAATAAMKEQDQFERSRLQLREQFRKASIGDYDDQRAERAKLLAAQIAEVDRAENEAMRKRQADLEQQLEQQKQARLKVEYEIFDARAELEMKGRDEIFKSMLEANELALNFQQKSTVGGSSQLAGGSNDRFGTGLVQSAQDAIRATSLKAEAQRDKQLNELQNIRRELEQLRDQNANPGPAGTMLEFGIFGGAS